MSVCPTTHSVTPDLVRVLAVLGRTYKPEAVAIWWNSGNKGLHGDCPSEVWEFGTGGGRDQVRFIADAIGGGG